MRRSRRKSFEELVMENKLELMRDSEAIERLEDRLEARLEKRLKQAE
ncbi:FbpB family small basic protein [Ectobacillus sp. JY-23]|nr:FbpB family small basic protein [Ectobacillus sp. JY-23]UOY93231.1 FbpB family small basic protein [Ectobacillus sp. JY-23]